VSDPVEVNTIGPVPLPAGMPETRAATSTPQRATNDKGGHGRPRLGETARFGLR